MYMTERIADELVRGYCGEPDGGVHHRLLHLRRPSRLQAVLQAT